MLRIKSRKIVLVLAVWVVFAGCSNGKSEALVDRPARGNRFASLLRVRPDSISLGRLNPGERAQTSLFLSNPHSRPIAIKTIETSCPCLKVSPRCLSLNSHEETSLSIVFDPEEDREFRGSLSVEVIAKGVDNSNIFCTQVDLIVSDAGESASSAAPSTK